jgi:hypothetical protein
MRRRLLLLAPVAALLAASAGLATQASASTLAKDPDVLYNSTVTPLPGNLPSQPFQAQQTSEFGNRVRMTKTAQPLGNVTVTMSSWGCQTGGGTTCVTTKGAKFTEPITLNLYNAPSTGSIVPGSLIASVTKAFSIPYRPSADNVNCTGGAWFDGPQGCFNGLAHNIVFSLASLHITLPQDFVFGIVYNTSQYGPDPNGCDLVPGANCPADSLNVALSQDPTNVTKGSDPDTGKVFWNTSTASDYCDGGAAGSGFFRLDSPTATCWGVNSPYTSAPFYIPAVQFMET